MVGLLQHFYEQFNAENYNFRIQTILLQTDHSFVLYPLYMRSWVNWRVLNMVHPWKHCKKNHHVWCPPGMDVWCSHKIEWAHPDPGEHVYLLCMRMANKVLTPLSCVKHSTCLLSSTFLSSSVLYFSLIHCLSLTSFAFLSSFHVPPSSSPILYFPLISSSSLSLSPPLFFPPLIRMNG